MRIILTVFFFFSSTNGRSPEEGAMTIVIKKNAKGVWYTDTAISEYLI